VSLRQRHLEAGTLSIFLRMSGMAIIVMVQDGIYRSSESSAFIMKIAEARLKSHRKGL
jgi:hypothetical protein